MPEYTYMCINHHYETITEPMLYDGEHLCGICDGEMWRKPGAVSVVWNGLPPHREHERGNELDQHFKDVDRNRERYQEIHDDD